MILMTNPQDTLQTITDLIAAAKRAGADAADAVMFETTDVALACRMGQQEGLERAESKGLGLRVFVGKQQASVSSNDLSRDTMDGLVERAVAMARIAPEDPFTGLAPAETLTRDIPELDLYDPNEPPVAWMMEQAKATEDAALSVAGITNSEGADAHYSASRIYLATSEGFAQTYPASSTALSVSVIAGTGVGMERDYDFSSARYVKDLMNAETIGKSAAERALKRLNPRKPETCQVPIIFDPRVARSLVGTFAGAIYGSSVARGTSFLKDKMGQQIFPEGISIIDDPHIRRGLGSRPFDGEGLANRKTILIENGVLKTWLLDLRSARQLGVAPGGHAARGLSGPPSPSTSNLYLANGTISPKDLIGDIASGFYVTDTFGMGINTITGDYSQGASGFWIEKGEITYPVSEITIAGQLKEMFLQITPANDLTFRYGTNTPTLRIERMTVAGT